MLGIFLQVVTPFSDYLMMSNRIYHTKSWFHTLRLLNPNRISLKLANNGVGAKPRLRLSAHCFRII